MNTRNVVQEIELLETVEEAERADAANQNWINNEINKLLPTGNAKESTMAAFERLTNKRPWIPFRMPNSTQLETDVDKAEKALFDVMKDDYSFDAKTGAKTYKRFQIAWNLQASQRFHDWCQDGDDVVQVRLKSETFLRDYYKATTELQSLESIIPRQGDADCDRMTEQLRATRNALPPAAPAQIARPVMYYNTAGMVPYGNPTTLNAAVTMAAMYGMRANNNMAPFRVGMPNLPTIPIPLPHRRVFRSKKYCCICGWMKSSHTFEEGKGGKDKRGNVHCKKNYCGNCYRRSDMHAGVPMGPDCTFTTDARCTDQVADWWEYKVCGRICFI
jgi:hypothetical protein